jgi:deoxyadenosine/deoxycytidine kinase
MFVEYAIETKIPEEICKKFHAITEKIIEKDIKYKLVITGNIGSGKSLRCELLYQLFNNLTKNIQCFPEYLNYSKHGKTMLKLRSKNLISALTFQNYILDEWENALKSQEYKNINIFERCPDDSVYCFSSHLPENEFEYLTKRVKQLNTKYNCPTYDLKNAFIKLVSDDIIDNIKTISDIILYDVENNIDTRIIGLEINTEISYDRIMKRNRNSEKNIEITTLNEFNSFYSNLYAKL